MRRYHSRCDWGVEYGLKCHVIPIFCEAAHSRQYYGLTIFGNPLRKAQVAGVDLPQISCIYQQLKFLDQSLSIL